MSIASKLQIKSEHTVALMHVPDNVILDLPDGTASTASPELADAVVVFVRDSGELQQRAGPALDAACRDALAWICYPKSGHLGTDLNRDRLWQTLESKGVRPVRQVAIDEVWSAVRFRPA